MAEVAQAASAATPSLPPAVEQPRADELRTPSGIETADAKASARRKPTVIRSARATAGRTSGGRRAPRGWQSARVSWYGPGFYGHTMAGGCNLTPTSMVVAHRSLPFGTRIEFSYKGRKCVAVVRDRGPFVAGRVFDLGPGTAKALRFSGVGTVNYRILSR
jgi:rare lipoprotein A (peptidoglycan hydrolase)